MAEENTHHWYFFCCIFNEKKKLHFCDGWFNGNEIVEFN